MPARAPASIDMLATVMRPSIDSAAIASPWYSTAWPVAPSVPIWAIVPRIRSLAVQPTPRLPWYEISIVCGRVCGSVWVASTCSTSLVPMPNASAPKAPWVEVWESPQTMVMPGWVTPSSGPITCTMPWRRWPRPYSGTPNSSQLRLSASSCACDSWSGWSRPVGTLWSAVASVRSGRRTRRPARRSPSNACGLVTSCTRCRSMNSSPSPTT